MKVLHCIYDHPDNPWVGGGGAVRAHEIYRRLADRMEIVIASGGFPGASDRVVDGVRYVHLGAPTPYALSRATYAAAANRLLRRATYDAAVFDLSVYTPVFVPRTRPVGVTVHHITGARLEARWGSTMGKALRGLECTLIRRARRLSATSRATRDELEALGLADAPVDIVAAGVDERLFAIPREESGYILYFGRLDVEHKGIDTLMRAFRNVIANHPTIRLAVAGRGQAEPIRRMALAEGVGAHVDVQGSVSAAEHHSLLAGAILQVMPSRFEGFGIAAVEALAAGVPLVATALGALRDVTDDAALLVPSDDPEALARAMLHLLDSAEERNRMCLAGRAVARRHDWNEVAEAHADFLTRLAGTTAR